MLVWSLSILVSLLLAGCVRASSPRAPGQPEPDIRKSLTDSLKPANIESTTTYSPGQLYYRLESFSVTHVTVGDSIPHTDSTRLTGNLTATFAAGPTQTTVIGQIRSDSIFVATGSGTSIPIKPSELAAFTIETQTGQVKPVNQGVHPSCTGAGASSSPISGREVVPSIHLRQAWMDTLYTTTCRAGTFLTIRRVASYTRLQLPDSSFQFLRSTQVQITGNGHQWDQKVEVSGEGTSTDTLYVSGFPLRLQQISGMSQIALLFRTPLRTQNFIQTTITHITLRN